MILIKENISLKPYNTFGFDVKTRYFVEADHPENLQEILEHPLLKNERKLFLGGGSNVLLINDFDGAVIKINFKGIDILKEDDDYQWIQAAAGEVWHEFVQHSLKQGLSGIENLSLIPGTVGAAPMQNIGAYGVEIKDTFDHLEAFNLETREVEIFDNQRCAFGYRNSYFKNEGKDRYVILKVCFKLSRNPKINVSYGAIQQTLAEMQITNPGPEDVSNAVIAIRRSKLPDPKEIGNSGSFFKNPEIPVAEYEKLKEKHPELPGYKVSDSLTKIPAGWLIEHAGWKGKRVGEVGVHAKQALVLINFGNGKGKEIADLAADIQKTVLEKYNIQIFPEVNYIY